MTKQDEYLDSSRLEDLNEEDNTFRRHTENSISMVNLADIDRQGMPSFAYGNDRNQPKDKPSFVS